MKKLRKFICSHLPIIKWLPDYTKEDILADIVSGITIGLTMMPQSMAYAGLADLTPQYGLYSSFMGSFAYIFFGTIKEVSIGPTSLMSLVSVEYTRGYPVEFMILLCFLSGIVELLMGVFKLGFLVDFISVPTVSGFQSATSIIIIVAQLKSLLGLKFSSGGCRQNINQLFTHIHETNIWDATLGITTIIVLLLLRQIQYIKVRDDRTVLKKCLWLISICRNFFVVVLSGFLAWFCTTNGLALFTLTGRVPQGLPTFKIPNFSSETDNETYTFIEMVQILGSGIIVIPIVAVLANIAIAKAFAHGKTVDASQEMITLGICNITGSFVQSMPTCGAFTRSAVSNASNVRSPMAGLYSGTLIILALTLLTPYFSFIPKSSLAAVLITAVLFMIDYHILAPLWKTNKLDFFTTVSTFCVSLAFGVEIGLLFGVLINICNLLRLWARPNISYELCETDFGCKYILITPSIGLFYPAVDYLRNEITKIALKDQFNDMPVVIDCKCIIATDYTASNGLQSIANDFNERNQKLIFININSMTRNTIECTKKLTGYASTESKLNDLLVFNEKNGISRDETFALLTDKNTETLTDKFNIALNDANNKL